MIVGTDRRVQTAGVDTGTDWKKERLPYTERKGDSKMTGQAPEKGSGI